MPPFYPIDSTPPWAMSIFMGLQHALAMAAGIVSIPIVISGATAFQLPTPDTQYLISVGLIMSGLSSLMQVHRFKLPNGKFLGTGGSGVVPVIEHHRICADALTSPFLTGESPHLPCSPAYRLSMADCKSITNQA
jgi:xanthine/uracil permease